MLRVIINIYVWLLTLITNPPLAIIAYLVWAANRPFDRKLRLYNIYCLYWSSIYLRCNPFWRIYKENTEKVDKKKIYVVVANHQSMLDILLLWNTKIPHKWVSKSEVFRTPFIGWQMRLHGDIELKRASNRGIANMIEDCKRKIEGGDSVLIFPEGTRSENDELKIFKTGAFKIALDTKTPILPIVHHGTGRGIPKGSILMKVRNTIRLKVLPEIPYEEFAHMNEKELSVYVYEIMKKEYDELKEKNT